MQGYPLDYHYYIREVGFWSRKLSGSIPLNCKINKNELDVHGHQIIFYYEEDVHGLKLKKNIENGIPSSELKTVLKCIYNLTDSEDSNAKFIGICSEDQISGLLAKANLGKFVLEIDKLDLFKRNNYIFPTNDVLRKELSDKVENYPYCQLHDMLRNEGIPFCCVSKANYIANLCFQISSKEQTLSCTV